MPTATSGARCGPLEREENLVSGLQRRYFAAAEAIAAIFERRIDGVQTHRVHADLHLGNVLLRDGRLHLLDFDDFVTGPAVQDMWLALPGRDRETERQREVFIDAYEQFRGFDRSTLHLIEPLRGLRMVRYAGWLSRRWHDPAFRQGWPWFGSDEYWLRETEDLEEQLAVIRGEVTASQGVSDEVVRTEEPVELTNKDYFWDYEE